MRRTLLDMVQSILNDLDSEPVNSISDSFEAEQIANVVKDTYYNLISARVIPEHEQLLALTALSDNTKPTFFRMPDRCKEIVHLAYDISSDSSYEYRTLTWMEPMDFLYILPTTASTNRTLVEINDGVKAYFYNDRMPTYYTSFDDYHVICDSHDNTIDSTLQQSKIRAYGTVYPVFSLVDSFEPDLDDTLLPLLLAEAKSTCFSIFKSGSDPKVEQAARRLKSFVQNDMYRVKRENSRPKYGKR